MASSRLRKHSAMRSIEDRAYRSVLYSNATQSRLPSTAVITDKSKSAVRFSNSIDSAVSPCRLSLAPGMPSAKGAKSLVIETLGFLVGVHHLKQGRAAGIGIALESSDEEAEGEVLMFKTVGDRPADAAQELVERWVAREVAPHRDEVDEVADRSLESGTGPPRYRRADKDVILAAETTEQDLEGRQQRRVQTDSQRLSQGDDPPGQHRIQVKVLGRSLIAPNARSGEIG